MVKNKWELRSWRLVCLCAVFLIALWTGTTSAETGPTQSELLRISNRNIIELKGPIAGNSAHDRVEATLRRIERVLEKSDRPKVALQESPYGTMVVLDGQPAFLVTSIDVVESIGEDTHVVADEARKRLERALIERREQSSRRYILRAVAYVTTASFLYLLLFWVTSCFSTWLANRLAGAAANHAAKLNASGINFFHVGRVLRFIRGLIVLISWLIIASLTVTWLAYSLIQFPYTRPWGEELERNLLELAKQGALAVAHAVPGLLVVLIIALAARTINRSAGWFFDRIRDGKAVVSWLDPESVRPTRRIFNFVIWVFALVMAYPYLPGSDTEAFKGLSVLIGLMVSLGGSSIVGQAASGLTLMYARTVRVGDYVRISESEGTIIEIGMVATRLRTGLGEEIIIPSATVMSSTTTNYSRAYPGTGYIVDTTITIGYATPWRQVHAMLYEAAALCADISKTQKPIVRQLALSDFYVEYRIAAYTPIESPRARFEVLSELHQNIQDVFNRYGVQIMSPHYLSDPPQPQVVPPQDWYMAPANNNTAQRTAPFLRDDIDKHDNRSG